MKRIFVIILSVLIVLFILSVAACQNTPSPETSPTGTQTEQPTAAPTPTPAPKKVGISMPTRGLQRWSQDIDHMNMKQLLETAGYEIDLQYGDIDDVSVQIAQIENMILGGCDVLVIAAVEGDYLAEVLAGAKEKNIPVIAYDRLIMNTDAVTYYVSFDNWLVGKMQGQFIKDKLDLDNAKGPFNIEFFTGDSEDNNINLFFSGAMEVLQPYLDNGKLVCKSKQTAIMQVTTQGWISEKAQERMKNLIDSQKYGTNKTKLDAVLCSNDSTAQGVTQALLDAGYTPDNFPIITGQDCDKASVKNMLAGTQSMSVFKDVNNVLDTKVAEMVIAILSGQEVSVSDTKNYDNGTGIIPSYLCEPVVVTKDNYREILIGSGYYIEEELLD